MNFKLPVFIAFIMLVGMASCKKEFDPPPTSGLVTNLNVVNATVDTINFYVNGARINNLSSLYPFGYSGYTGVPLGELTYQFKKIRTSAVLFELPLALDANKNYSVFVGGQTAEQAFSVTDTLVADTNGKAKIKFVNASPGTANLDVFVGDTVNFKVRAFKSSTVFLTINPGEKRIRIYQSGVAAIKVDEKRTLQGGRIYTLFSRGTVAGTGGNALGTGLVVNR